MQTPESELWQDTETIVTAVGDGSPPLFLETDTYRVSRLEIREIPTLTYVLSTSIDYIGVIRIPECRSRFDLASETLLSSGAVERLGPDTAMFYYPTAGEQSKFLYEYGFACRPDTDPELVARALPASIAKGLVRVKTVRGCRCASVVFVGSPSDIGHGRRALQRQLMTADLSTTGTHAREIYHHLPDPESPNCITELMFVVLPSHNGAGG